MAVAVGYLSTAVYADAALLGASFLQFVFSGQAAIGVAASLVQVASSMIVLWSSSPKSVSMEVIAGDTGDDHAEELAARIFFGVSAAFLCIPLIAYTWLTRRSFYEPVTSALEQHHRDMDELTQLLADYPRNSPTVPSSHVFQVLRNNLVFMLSFACVLSVTLVSGRALHYRNCPDSTFN